MKRVFTFLFLMIGVSLASFAQRLEITVNSPEALAGVVTTPIGQTAGWDVGTFEDPITADAELYADASANPSFACEPVAAGTYEGKIVFVRRGVCPFILKAENAAAAGAVGVIVVNNVPGDDVLTLGGDRPTPLDIPVYMFGQATGEPLIAAIENNEGVNMTLAFVEVEIDVEISIARNPLNFLNRYATPFAFQALDTIDFFSCVVDNIGSRDLNDVELIISLKDSEGNVLHQGGTTFDVPGGEFIILTSADIAVEFILTEKLPIGTYFIEYRITNEEIEENDENLANNVRSIEFVVTDGSFYSSARYSGTVSIPSGVPANFPEIPYASGALFEFYEAEETFILNSVDFAIAGVGRTAAGGNVQDPSILDGADINVLFLKVLNLGAVLNGAGTYADQDIIGFGEYTASSADHFEVVSVPITDLDENPLVLENDFFYLPMVEFPSGTIWQSYDTNNFNRWANFSSPTGGTVYFFPASYYWEGAFAGVVSAGVPAITLNLSIVTSVGEVELPEYAVSVFPNPASSNASVELTFEQPTNVTITLAEMNGKVIRYDRVENALNEIHNLDVSGLPAGTYIVKVSSKEASAVRKLVVLK